MDFLNIVGNTTGSFWNWITGTANNNTAVNVAFDPVNNIWNYGADFFNKLGEIISAGIGAVLYTLFKEPMGFLAGIVHFLQLAGDLINYLIAPFWYLANFLAGFFSYVSMPAAIVASNTAFNNNSINGFLAAFPGWTELMLVVNAALWALLAFHVLRELKHV